MCKIHLNLLASRVKLLFAHHECGLTSVWTRPSLRKTSWAQRHTWHIQSTFDWLLLSLMTETLETSKSTPCTSTFLPCHWDTDTPTQWLGVCCSSSVRLKITHNCNFPLRAAYLHVHQLKISLLSEFSRTLDGQRRHRGHAVICLFPHRLKLYTLWVCSFRNLEGDKNVVQWICVCWAGQTRSEVLVNWMTSQMATFLNYEHFIYFFLRNKAEQQATYSIIYWPEYLCVHWHTSAYVFRVEQAIGRSIKNNNGRWHNKIWYASTQLNPKKIFMN